MTRTAIYCRVSTPGQKNTTSLPEQQRLCREKAATLGWEVSEPHVYREVEGGEDLYRPQMDRLWGAMAAHEVDGLIIDVLDRLSRNEGDLGAVYHHADLHGVQIELATEDRDETEKGRAMRTLTGILASMERAEIRRRTQRGRHARVTGSMNKSPAMLTGAWPLYGYLWGDPDKGQRTHYIIDPETAPIVVRIFESVAAGVPLRRLMRDLEDEGMPTPFQVLDARGQLPKERSASPIWRHGQLIRMLHHPAYWGAHSAYRTQTTTVKVRPPETGVTIKVKVQRERDTDDPDRVALAASAPALVSKELAERAQARLTHNKEENTGNNPDPLATLWRGLAYCGHCGERMGTAPAARSEGRRYFCRSRLLSDSGIPTNCPGGHFTINANVLDPAGWADVRAWLSEPENVARLLAEWEKNKQTGERTVTSRLEAATATLANVRERMTALVEDISTTARGESRQVLNEKLDQLAAQFQIEEGKRDRLLREARETADHARDERAIREWVCEVASHAADFTRIEQRAALWALGAQVTVWRGDYVHEDSWPQRYQIDLTFTGFTGPASITLPARNPQSNYSYSGSCWLRRPLTSRRSS
jgi:DNA invertase Pin-like site-specific DNA recombinase